MRREAEEVREVEARVYDEPRAGVGLLQSVRAQHQVRIATLRAEGGKERTFSLSMSTSTIISSSRACFTA
jgi:hypothetical protein